MILYSREVRPGMYQAYDVIEVPDGFFVNPPMRRLHETVMKQFITPTKPFSAFDANLLKPLPASHAANNAPNGRDGQSKQGTSLSLIHI